MNGINRREFLFPFLLALAFIAVGSLPYWYGYATAHDDEVFMGFVGRGTPGAQGYLMLAQQVMGDRQLMENKMTNEPLPRTYVNVEFWLYGKFAKYTGLGLMGTFHAWRALTAIAYLCIIYFLAALCLPTVFLRRTALLLIALGSGLGWIIWCINVMTPLDLPLPLDLNGVAISGYLMNKPHFIRGGLFAALQYAFLILGERSGQRKYFAYSGLAGVAHSFVRPYHLPETYLVLAIFPLLLCARERRLDFRRLGNYFTAGLVLSPIILYFGWMAYENTLGMAGWKRQSLFLLQDFFWMGIPFTVVAAHFVCTGASQWRTARPEYMLLGLWLFTAWALNQTFPWFTAGHELAFYAYTTVPPIILLGVTVPALARMLPAPVVEGFTRRRTLACTLLILATVPTSIYTYVNFYTNLREHNPPWKYYLTRDVYDTIAWLRDNTPSDAVVLATRDTSQFIPVLGDRKIVSGHDMLTAWYQEKNWDVQRFYGVLGDEAFKREMLYRYRVSYVLLGPDERALGHPDFAALPFLRPVHTQGDVVLYEFIPQYPEVNAAS